jgi:hypothetical protein
MSTTPDPCAAGLPALMPLWVAGLYRDAHAGLRAQLLERLLRPMGVLGLVAVADGVFAALRHRHGWHDARVTAEDTAAVSADHVFQLAAYLQERAPEALASLTDLLASHPAALATVSGALLWDLLRRSSR